MSAKSLNVYMRVFPCRLAVIDVELCGSTVYFSRDDDIFDLEHQPPQLRSMSIKLLFSFNPDRECDDENNLFGSIVLVSCRL